MYLYHHALMIYLFICFWWWWGCYFAKRSLTRICLIFTTPDQTTHSVHKTSPFPPTGICGLNHQTLRRPVLAEEDSQLLQTGQQTRG